MAQPAGGHHGRRLHRRTLPSLVQPARQRHEVDSRSPGQNGFAALPRRGVVERSFGWLTRWGGLLRNRAGRLDVARLACANVLASTETLINPV